MLYDLLTRKDNLSWFEGYQRDFSVLQMTTFTTKETPNNFEEY